MSDDTTIDPRDGELRYCLRDVITVNPGDMKRFEHLMQTKVLKLFQTSGWKLVNASYAASGNTNTVVHLWHMPSADSLLSNMLQFLENEDYSKLHACVLNEEQQILSPTRMCPLIDFQTRKRVQDGERQFLAQTVVVRKPGKDEGRPVGMTAFLRSFAVLVPLFALRGWDLVHSSYSVTGRPSTIVNLFEVSQAGDLIDLPRSFVGDPYESVFRSLALSIDSEERRLIAPLNYCPILTTKALGWQRLTNIFEATKDDSASDYTRVLYQLKKKGGSRES